MRDKFLFGENLIITRDELDHLTGNQDEGMCLVTFLIQELLKLNSRLGMVGAIRIEPGI